MEEKKGSLVWGVHRSTIQEALNVPNRNLDFNISYLAKNGLVRLVTAQSNEWVWARITSVGTDLLDSPARYEERFPFAKTVSKMTK